MPVTVDVEVRRMKSLRVPRPTLARSESAAMGTKRKIMCFSGACPAAVSGD